MFQSHYTTVVPAVTFIFALSFMQDSMIARKRPTPDKGLHIYLIIYLFSNAIIGGPGVQSGRLSRSELPGVHPRCKLNYQIKM